jgi:hypothetical protein
MITLDCLHHFKMQVHLLSTRHILIIWQVIERDWSFLAVFLRMIHKIPLKIPEETNRPSEEVRD